MTRKLTCDLAVIGAGSGGLSVAAGAAQLGLKVVLFEKGEMGGDCLNTGCVPSKALIAAAKAAHQMRTAGRFGVGAAEPRVDWPAVQAHIRGVIETIAPIDSQDRFEGLGCTVIREAARFTGPRTLESASVSVRARRIVVAAGGRAALPGIPGLADIAAPLTNENIFAIAELPASLLILGAGPIGVELGQAFARLGVKVTILEAGTPLARFDAELTAPVLAGLKAEGVDLRIGATVTGLARAEGGAGVRAKLSSGETVTADRLLLAAGRKPNTEGLNLEAAGVAYDGRGIRTDERLRTSNPAVFAVGDIAGRDQLTHAAGWHASVFVRTTLFRAPGGVDAVAMPAGVYTDPELAQIGLTEAQARETFGDAMTVTRWRFEENDRAQAERAHEGLVKLVLGKGGKILGCGVVGEGAADILQIAGLAMANGLKAQALTAQIAPYPTRAEAIKRAASAYFTPLVFGPRARALVGFLQRLP
jgi:pyruvate/2-oxoglutarate dehydrogenase complex dihydrolipoamide dehydrogenase (E3) component